jgi:hypothetical protein
MNEIDATNNGNVSDGLVFMISDQTARYVKRLDHVGSQHFLSSCMIENRFKCKNAAFFNLLRFYFYWWMLRLNVIVAIH